MNVLRISLFVLLTLFASPVAIVHGCALGSWPMESAIVLVLLGYPLALKRIGAPYSWNQVIAAPFLSLAITLVYFTWLHSDYFPGALLDRSAIESLERMKVIKQGRLQGSI